MSRVWVNSKWLTSDNPKAEKWKPDPPKERVLWGKCSCGEAIYEGDSVGMYGEHTRVICFTCFATGLYPEMHHDCAGLHFPGATLSQ